MESRSLHILNLSKSLFVIAGLGYAMVATSWLISVYYNVVISHVMCYLFASFASIPTQLPWISCDNVWNTPDCLIPEYKGNQTDNSTTITMVTAATTTVTSGKFTTEEDLL